MQRDLGEVIQPSEYEEGPKTVRQYHSEHENGN